MYQNERIGFLRNDFIQRLLDDCGIEEGMRILDVGCGSGELSIMASELVGTCGEVVGLDISESTLALARKAATERHVPTLRFVQADIAELPENIGTFDMIIGRRVLMYLGDAAESIDVLLSHVAAKGKLVFQESDCMAVSPLADSLPLHARVQDWIWDTVTKEGGNIYIGRQLYSLLKNTRLKIALLRAEAILHTPESDSDLGWLAKMMEPRMIAQGVVTAEELDADTLESRLRLELSKSDTPFIRDMAFGICAES
jgi:SAM-dependent methyltransferase